MKDSWLGAMSENFLKNLEYLDWFKIHFQTWPKVFLQTLFKTKYLGAQNHFKGRKIRQERDDDDDDDDDNDELFLRYG